jgi:hypothetical protein
MDNDPFIDDVPMKMVIFYGYVSLLEGNNTVKVRNTSYNWLIINSYKMLQVTSAFKCGYHSINDLVGGFNTSE